MLFEILRLHDLDALVLLAVAAEVSLLDSPGQLAAVALEHLVIVGDRFEFLALGCLVVIDTAAHRMDGLTDTRLVVFIQLVLIFWLEDYFLLLFLLDCKRVIWSIGGVSSCSLVR